jgi:hypothetical protein
MITRLKSRLARLESVTLPNGDPVDFEVVFINPDGTVSNTLTIKFGAPPPARSAANGRTLLGK